MRNEHELSYETLTSIYLGSYEHHKGVGAGDVEGVCSVPLAQQDLGPKKGDCKDLSDVGLQLHTRGISSIPIGGSISPEGFLLPVLLLVVIIVTVVIVIASFDVVGYVGGFLQSLRLRGSNISFNTSGSRAILIGQESFQFCLGIPVGSVFLLGLLALAIIAACTSRAVAMPLAISCWMAAKVIAGVSDVYILLGGILST
ncbi:hypothetical protein Tco_0140749 [Tanacetum coccineum]